ncbi:hypothetical protein VTN77DRAFT_7886 [Rasamsonia byssochlamydoides]|uniref:uncharacterized protein n=1 Tax=Rasamsonia byssochlamydoides TaxID=89139 RepID=UPI00374410A5
MTTESPAQPRRIPLYRLLISQSTITDEVLNHQYAGSGTPEDPYRVEWIRDDPRNPLLMPSWMKWMITLLQAFSFLSITFASSALSAANPQIQAVFGASTELVVADTSLFVLAFAIGPALWAPLSELYGRQALYFITYGMTTLFAGAAIASKNIGTLLVLRFFSGAFGASSISNAGGVVSDMYSSRERGLATIAFIGAPFLGPSLGPIACDFLAVSKGWKWVEGLIAIFNGVSFILGVCLIPETYAPVLLQRRAAKLSKMTGKVYKSQLEVESGHKTAAAVFNKTMVRPWALLFREPIVLLLSVYMAIIYGTMYMEFAAFPVVFNDARHWQQSTSGLSFLGVMIGQILGCVYSTLDDKRYKRLVDRIERSRVTPEARLVPSMVGAVTLPVGLFWFAWTNYPSIHWMACQLGTVLFGFSHVSIFLSVVNYLVDAYTLYAASALAGNAVIRALFGAAFPLFTTPMYDALGIHWASSIPAFLALACLPFPWIFYKFGPRIRRHCRYSAESARLLDEMTRQQEQQSHQVTDNKAPATSASSASQTVGAQTPDARLSTEPKVGERYSGDEDLENANSQQ